MIQTDAPYAREPEHADPQTLRGRYSTWKLMPNMRIGTFSHYRDNSQPVYATFDGSSCCHHGEVAGTIRAWCHHEKARSLVRWSTCICTSTQGLARKVKQDDLPTKPNSYYELLQDANSERLEMENDSAVVALATPLRCESGPVFLSDDGRFFCGHGSEFIVKALPTARKQARVDPADTPIKKPHRTIRRRFQTKCACRLVLPNRMTFPELPLVTEQQSD